MHRHPATKATGVQSYALALHEPMTVPPSFNGFRTWNWLVLVLMLAAYGFPIAQFLIDPPPQAVVHRVD
jgi:cytochrome c oxidase subunit 1